mmetsp:Transcript_9774/g.19189  ORF Transcript_9774/g.19189 Transcript_9774/m.19189 type:complete len:214 (+) Transcript_9774:370-1011(+)
MTTSAPAWHASTASSRFLHSTSILDEKPAAALALCTAFVMSPTLHTWLSFNMTICERVIRCVLHPPTSTAYFSTRENPGVVFLVAATSPCQLWASLTKAIRREAVAMPLALVMMLSTVRSAIRILRAGPRTLARTLRFWASSSEISTPSLMSHSTETPTASKTACAKGTPAMTPGLLPRSMASRSTSPTTKPPTSNSGASATSQPRTRASRRP